jgi:MoxR-like ATPase
VLLIDEFDKSDVDLAYDLLNVFEEGTFEIPELTRLPPDQDEVRVMTADRGRVTIHGGVVTCKEFPLVIITSNAEREFPSAFQRRCLRYTMPEPTPEALGAMVAAHLGESAVAECMSLIERYQERRLSGDVTPDQLLNACMIALTGGSMRFPEKLEGHLMAPVGGLEP